MQKYYLVSDKEVNSAAPLHMQTCSGNALSSGTKPFSQQQPKVPDLSIPSIQTPEMVLLEEFNDLNKIRNNLSKEELWQQYAQLLIKYLAAQKIGTGFVGATDIDTGTTQSDIQASEQSTSKNIGQILLEKSFPQTEQGGNAVNKIIDQTVQSLPKSVQRTGRLLFNALAIPERGGVNLPLRITNTGQIVLVPATGVGSQIIQGSHIFDLVHYLLRPNRKHVSEPQGWKNFIQILKNSPSIPKSMLEKVLARRKIAAVGPGVIVAKGRRTPIPSPPREKVPTLVWQTGASTDEDESAYKTPIASIKGARARSHSFPISSSPDADPEVLFLGSKAETKSIQKRKKSERERRESEREALLKRVRKVK